MIDRPVTLHVGFSKTATTSLQNFVFARIPGVSNLGKPYTAAADRKSAYQAITHLTFAEELAYDAAGTLQKFAGALGGAAGPVLISSEGFTYGRHNDPALVARRLHAIFRNATILFTIREQMSWILSLYLDDCGRFVFMRPAPRLETWFGLEGRKRNRNALGMADFATTISYYEQLFGRDRVHVLPYEQLIAEPGAFAASLERVLGVDRGAIARELARLPRTNTALSGRAYRFGLFNYYLVPHALRPYLLRVPGLRRIVLGGAPARPKIPPEYARRIRESVANGNREIAARYGLDLRKYGYPL